MYIEDKNLINEHLAGKHDKPVFGCDKCSGELTGLRTSPAQEVRRLFTKLIDELCAFRARTSDVDIVNVIDELLDRAEVVSTTLDSFILDYEQLRHELSLYS